MSANLTTSAASAGRTGSQLGDYALGPLLWRLRISEAYRATGPSGPATVLVLDPRVAATPAVVQALHAQAQALARAPEHKHLVRMIGLGQGDGTWFVAIEEIDGSNVRDALARKRGSQHRGFGVRGAGNLVSAAAGALTKAGVLHGALAAESMVVTRSGGVRMVDLILGPATVAAVRAGLVQGGGWLAPEVGAGKPVTAAADVYGLGALLYEGLIGTPLARGGPRPSEAGAGVTPQIDELIARACNGNPANRFASPQVFGELCIDALGKGAVLTDAATPMPTLTSPPSSSSSGIAATAARSPSLAESLSRSSGQHPVDRALAAALSDTTEKWLIAKGRLDYGPFSIVNVIEQINSGEIVAGNIIVDKDTGARIDIAQHPLLSPLIDAAKQAHDEQRRANAEVTHQGREKRRGVMLFGVIGAGVVALAIGVYLIIQAASGDKEQKVEGISTVGEASLQVSISQPKKPPKRAPGTGGPRPASRGRVSGLGGNADQALDMSDEEDDEGSESLDMNTVYGVYSRSGGQLGGCLRANGGGSANISIIIDGRSGTVSWLRVNGEKAGGLFNCMGRVIKRMKFPSINGPRTRAEFDISI